MDREAYVKVLKYAMEMERKAEEFYTMYKDKVQEESNKAIFRELSEMEDDHYEILEKQLKKVEKDGEFEHVDVAKLSGGDDIFKLSERDIESIDFSKEVEDLPILRMAYAMESHFAEFYAKAAEKAEDPNAKALLETLAKWEQVHKESFRKEIEFAMENSWFNSGFYPL